MDTYVAKFLDTQKHLSHIKHPILSVYSINPI